MKSKFTRWVLWGVALAAIVVLYRSVIFVPETQFSIVTQFGRPVRSLLEAGLHFKWPFQSLIQVDRRLQVYDPVPSEFLAEEKKNVTLDVFVCWKVVDPLRFLETVRAAAEAQPRIHDIVWSTLADAVATHPLETLVSTDESLHDLDGLLKQVAATCAERADDALGIEIVDVKLKRIGQPAQVRESVFQRMRTERGRIASRYRAEGEEEAMKIRAVADRDRAVALARAQADAEEIRGEAEAEAARIYAEAYAKDPEFYDLLRSLEAYRKFLDEKTTILLSSDSPLLKFLTGELIESPMDDTPQEADLEP